MSSPARAARRAAERAAAKQARKAERFTAPIVHPAIAAQQSRATAESKAAVQSQPAAAQTQSTAADSQPAAAPTFTPVKWGQTARTLLLPAEEAPLWDSHLESYFAQYRPVTEQEFTLVGQMAETWWRAEHIPVLVADLYALGAVTFASLFANEPEASRPSLIRGHTHMTYCQRIEKLYLQESRLQRHYFQLSKQLRELRAEREAQTTAQESISLPAETPNHPNPAHPEPDHSKSEHPEPAHPEPRRPNHPNGFEFSNLSPAAMAKLKEADSYLIELPDGTVKPLGETTLEDLDAYFEARFDHQQAA